MTYALPVTLSRSADGAWSASWVADNITAKTPGSIATDNSVIWMGVVSRSCMDAATRAYLASRPEGDGGGGGPPPPAPPAPPAGAAALGLHGGAAGGVGALAWETLCPTIAAAYAEGAAFEGSGGFDAAAGAPLRMGDPCPALSPADRAGIVAALNALCVLPIFLPPLLHEGFASYALSVLRPALHNVLETGSQRVQPAAASLDFLAAGWRHYSAANEAIAAVLNKFFVRGDVIWWHDFWLMRAPAQVAALAAREGAPRPAQVWYLHAPFATSEVFRTIPMRDELLLGVLECDLVGFHTFNHARHFLHACKRLLGFPQKSRPGGQLAVDADGRDVLITISHVGVEAGTLDAWMCSAEAAATSRALEAAHARPRVVVAGVDALTRLSGVALKLLAFERLMEDYPNYRGKVVLVQRCETGGAVLPADLIKAGTEIRERVAAINEQFAAFGQVIDYAEAPFFSPAYRMGLFHRADVLLQLPVCEGLNMLPLEYVYAHTRWQLARAAEAAAGADGGAAGARPPPSAYLSDSPVSSKEGFGSPVADFGGSPLSPFAASGGETTDGDETRLPRDGGGSGTPESLVPPLPVTAASLPPPPRSGCTILSEFSSAACVLNSTTRVNPWAIKHVAWVIDQAIIKLDPDTERAYKQWRDFQYAVRNPSANWSRAVLRDVRGLREERAAEAGGGSGGGGGGDSTPASPTPPFAPGAGAGVKLHVQPVSCEEIAAAFRAAKQRALILDYGGTLVERSASMGRGALGFGNRHDFHMDGFSQTLPAGAQAAIEALAGAPGTTVYVVSGLRVTAVDALGVASVPGVGVAAENGMYVSHPWAGGGAAAARGGGRSSPTGGLVRERSLRGAGVGGLNLAALGLGGGGSSGGGSGGGGGALLGESGGDAAPLTVPDGLLRPNWATAGMGEGVESLFLQWTAVKRVAVALMREYESRVNGSVLREYGSFVAWDFRAVDAEWAGSQARFLAADLEAAIKEGGEGFKKDVALTSVAITMRKTRVEVSLRYWNKGRLARDILARLGAGIDFVLAIGDDATDEDCFAAVGAWRDEGAVAGVKGATVFPVTVGRKLGADTKAGAYLADVSGVHALLGLLAEAARK